MAIAPMKRIKEYPLFPEIALLVGLRVGDVGDVGLVGEVGLLVGFGVA
jgi:hypothetical protein